MGMWHDTYGEKTKYHFLILRGFPPESMKAGTSSVTICQTICRYIKERQQVQILPIFI
jgi:hypothetical protein